MRVCVACCRTGQEAWVVSEHLRPGEISPICEAIGNAQHSMHSGYDSGYHGAMHTCISACLYACMLAFCVSPPIPLPHTFPVLFVDSLYFWVCLDCFSICWVLQKACTQCEQRQEQVIFAVSKCCRCEWCPHACIVLQHIETPGSYDLSLSPSLSFILSLSFPPSLPRDPQTKT